MQYFFQCIDDLLEVYREIPVLDVQADLVALQFDLMHSVGGWLILGGGDQEGELGWGFFVNPCTVQT